MNLTPKEIRQANEKIAVFMGGKCEIIFTSTVIVKFKTKSYKLGDLKYHKKYDWLMPVVEKICRIKFEDGDTKYLRQLGMTNSDTGELMARFNRSFLHCEDKLIDALYLAVIDAIS